MFSFINVELPFCLSLDGDHRPSITHYLHDSYGSKRSPNDKGSVWHFYQMQKTISSRTIIVLIMLHGRCNVQTSTGKTKDCYRPNLRVLDFSIEAKPTYSLITKISSGTDLLKFH